LETKSAVYERVKLSQYVCLGVVVPLNYFTSITFGVF